MKQKNPLWINIQKRDAYIRTLLVSANAAPASPGTRAPIRETKSRLLSNTVVESKTV